MTPEEERLRGRTAATHHSAGSYRICIALGRWASNALRHSAARSRIAPELEDVVGLCLCRSLNRESVRYLLIGGWAVILHGAARTTKVIDLLVDPAPENVQAIRRALADLPDNAARELADGEVAQYGVVRIADEVVVDLMASACGVTLADAIAANAT